MKKLWTTNKRLVEQELLWLGFTEKEINIFNNNLK